MGTIYIWITSLLWLPFLQGHCGWGAEVWEKGMLCSRFYQQCQALPLSSSTKGSSAAQNSLFSRSSSATARKVSCSWGRWAPPPSCPTPNAWWTMARAGHPPSRSVKMSWGQHRGSGISPRCGKAEEALKRCIRKEWCQGALWRAILGISPSTLLK